MGFSGRLPKFIQPITTKISSNNSASTSCLLDQSPPLDSTQFEIKKRIKVAKGTSGNVVELYPRFAERAHQVGGNVVINYNASQRFGFWPWRIVRPVIWGTAVKWKTPVDCKALGGIEI